MYLMVLQTTSPWQIDISGYIKWWGGKRWDNISKQLAALERVLLCVIYTYLHSPYFLSKAIATSPSSAEMSFSFSHPGATSTLFILLIQSNYITDHNGQRQASAHLCSVWRGVYLICWRECMDLMIVGNIMMPIICVPAKCIIECKSWWVTLTFSSIFQDILHHSVSPASKSYKPSSRARDHSTYSLQTTTSAHHKHKHKHPPSH